MLSCLRCGLKGLLVAEAPCMRWTLHYHNKISQSILCRTFAESSWWSGLASSPMPFRLIMIDPRLNDKLSHLSKVPRRSTTFQIGQTKSKALSKDLKLLFLATGNQVCSRGGCIKTAKRCTLKDYPRFYLGAHCFALSGLAAIASLPPRNARLQKFRNQAAMTWHESQPTKEPKSNK